MYKKTIALKISIACISILLVTSSCGFFEDELKQDKQLAYYRYQISLVAKNKDIDKIHHYKEIIEKASGDELLITLRKKNKLLSEAYNALSSEYYEKKDWENAIACTSIAIVIDSGNHYAYYNRACIYQKIGKDSLAIEDYGQAILNDSKYADSYYNRGIIHEKQTDFQLAVEDYTHAIKLEPSYLVDVYNNRGNVYQEMKFYDKAIKDYDAAIVLDSTNAVLYCNRADAYSQLGDSIQANDSYRKAASIDTVSTAVLNKLKHAREEIGKRKRKGKLAV